MHWTLADLEALPVEEYNILVEWLAEQFKARARD
jgi:NDP-sugar pyrophosphorylase family protein